MRIARSPENFISECEAAMAMRSCGDDAWLREADKVVEKLSWDSTFGRMCELIEEAINRRASAVALRLDADPDGFPTAAPLPSD